MAKPRIFISSTFYDLHHVRDELRQFIDDLGYDPVLFERGDVPYGRKEKLEEYAYREIELCDIVVCIVGGRYGAQSSSPGYSISQKELKRAYELGKQIYIFVDKNVKAEYETYRLNKDNKRLKFRFADDRKVYEFLEEVNQLPRNNPIFSFDSQQEITRLLRDQWAGLFHRLLQEEAERPFIDGMSELRGLIGTLKAIVSVTAVNGKDTTVETIMQFNHPAFSAIKKVLRIKHRVVFINLNELSELLRAKGFKPVNEEHWDSPETMEWIEETDNSPQDLLKIPSGLFDSDGGLIPPSESEELAAQIRVVAWPETFVSEEEEDEVPF